MYECLRTEQKPAESAKRSYFHKMHLPKELECFSNPGIVFFHEVSNVPYSSVKYRSKFKFYFSLAQLLGFRENLIRTGLLSEHLLSDVLEGALQAFKKKDLLIFIKSV